MPWQHRSQRGLSEVQLLLIENTYMPNTVLNPRDGILCGLDTIQSLLEFTLCAVPTHKIIPYSEIIPYIKYLVKMLVVLRKKSSGRKVLREFVIGDPDLGVVSVKIPLGKSSGRGRECIKALCGWRQSRSRNQEEPRNLARKKQRQA